MKTSVSFTADPNATFLGAKKQACCRLVQLCDIESRTAYWFATNLSAEVLSDEDIGNIYRQHWRVELMFRFAKMHLKPDRMLLKHERGVLFQAFITLIVYLILVFLDIPKIYPQQLLDKLRYTLIVTREEQNLCRWSKRYLIGASLQ
ncbi:transposase [Parathermosynechococcus lividus]